MTRFSLLPDVLWSFFGLSVAATGCLAVISYKIIRDDDYSWPLQILMGIAVLATMGLMVCTLVLLGHPVAALEVWRVASVLITVLMLFLAFSRGQRPFSSIVANSGTPIPMLGVTIVTATATATIPAYFMLASFVVRALPVIDGRLLHSTGHAPTSAEASATTLATASSVFSELGQLDFWHSALYVTLIAAAVIFGLLFITATVREGPIAVEKSWGGLGGSSGGWEISSSLTYLVATIAIGALLISLIYHSDKLQAEAKAGAAMAQPSISKTAGPAAEPAASSSTGAVPQGNKAAPASAGAATTAGAHSGVQSDAH